MPWKGKGKGREEHCWRGRMGWDGIGWKMGGLGRQAGGWMDGQMDGREKNKRSYANERG